MPRRDPETGQFVASDAADSYDDIEQVTQSVTLGIGTSDSASGTGDELPATGAFEGYLLIDYDDVVDRDERADLLRADHRVQVGVRENQAAPGFVHGVAEISSSPARDVAVGVSTASGVDIQMGSGDTVSEFQAQDSDSVDIVGRVMRSFAYNPHQDFSTGDSWGTGGGGAAMDDAVVLAGLPARMREFHPRDELFLNGEIESSGFGGAEYLQLDLQHWYGVTER